MLMPPGLSEAELEPARFEKGHVGGFEGEGGGRGEDQVDVDDGFCGEGGDGGRADVVDGEDRHFVTGVGVVGGGGGGGRGRLEGGEDARLEGLEVGGPEGVCVDDVQRLWGAGLAAGDALDAGGVVGVGFKEGFYWNTVDRFFCHVRSLFFFSLGDSNACSMDLSRIE